MKILLIDPPGWDSGINSGLAYLCAALKAKDISVQVLDLNNHRLPPEAIVDFARAFAPNVVGLSAKSKTWKTAVATAQLIRQSLSPGPWSIAGGPHVTLMDEEVGETPFDFLFTGYAEQSLLATVLSLPSPFSISSDRPKVIPGVSLSDLDSLAFPDFGHFFPDPGNLVRDRYPLVTSRGCQLSCSYCSVGLITGKLFKHRSPENVVAELAEAKARYSIRRFEVIDDNFTFRPERAKRICERIIETGLNLEWSCPNGIWARSVDRELAALMSRAGCRKVWLGIENADEEVFNQIHKGESLDHIRAAIRALKDAGVAVGGFFIIGLPGDTLPKSLKALRFIRENHLDSAFFNLFVPYPKTPAYEWARQNGTITDQFTEGTHYGVRPRVVFETPEMPAGDRLEAYEHIYTHLHRFDILIPGYSALSLPAKAIRVLTLLWRHDRSAILSHLLRWTNSRLATVFRPAHAEAAPSK